VGPHVSLFNIHNTSLITTSSTDKNKGQMKVNNLHPLLRPRYIPHPLQNEILKAIKNEKCISTDNFTHTLCALVEYNKSCEYFITIFPRQRILYTFHFPQDGEETCITKTIDNCRSSPYSLPTAGLSKEFTDIFLARTIEFTASDKSYSVFAVIVNSNSYCKFKDIYG
jgi:hypothetical protein